MQVPRPLSKVALLSDAQRDQLAAYSAAGASLVATFETGLYDETGKPRANFALGDLFGIRKTGERETRLRSLGTASPAPALYRLTGKHPITAGFRDTEWIEGAPWTVPFESDATPFLKFIPAYPWYPTEMSIVPVEQAKLPVGIARERSNSRLVS